MERLSRFLLFAYIAMYGGIATAATGRASKYVNPESYSYMYPYLSNQMRAELNPGTTVSMTNNPIDVIVKTEQVSEPRRVVARPNKRTAGTATTARAATAQGATKNTNTQRRVVARNNNNAARSATTTGRKTAQNTRTAATTTTTSSETPTYSRCLADYTACMDGYCRRENMAYNRCYCSAKLAQIDAQYQEPISNLINQIIVLQNGESVWTAEEMNEYWMEKIGNYTGTHSWERLDAALDIEWPTADERVRGQNVFVTGHSYCVQHLRGCAPMASNMRDSYRSIISRDCQSYEKSLNAIKNVAESFIEYYSE